MSRHPLDDEFNLSKDPYDDDYISNVNIPEEAELRDLDMVIDLALKQYKDNCDDMALLEPKNRIKIMELNRDLLNIVKDSRYKKEMIELKRTGGKKTKQPQQGEDAGDGVNRNELAERVAKLRAVK